MQIPPKQIVLHPLGCRLVRAHSANLFNDDYLSPLQVVIERFAGTGPGGPVTFLWYDKKVTKEAYPTSFGEFYPNSGTPNLVLSDWPGWNSACANLAQTASLDTPSQPAQDSARQRGIWALRSNGCVT